MPVSDVPPGLEPISSIKVVAAGGDSTWLPYAGRTLFWNAVPIDEVEDGKVLKQAGESRMVLSHNCFPQVLLAWKTQGFGRNRVRHQRPFLLAERLLKLLQYNPFSGPIIPLEMSPTKVASRDLKVWSAYS